MGFLLTSLGFPSPINLSLSLGFMSLPWTPYSLSLHCFGPTVTLSHFSNSYSAHGMLFLSFLASLSPLAFSRPMYTFVGPVTHYSYRLGLMGFFAIYPVNSLWPSLLGPSVCWASTNGPQHLAPWTYETLLQFICEWKGASALLLSSFFFFFFAVFFF